MDTEFGFALTLGNFHSPNVPISPQDILSRNLFIWFFFLLFNVPLSLLPLVETAGFNERSKTQQIIPNRNVPPWSWTLLPDALCLFACSSS